MTDPDISEEMFAAAIENRREHPDLKTYGPYDRELGVFTALMRFKLEKNAHRGKWEDAEIGGIMKWLRSEIDELEKALKDGDPIQILLESADVGNLAMIAGMISIRAKNPNLKTKTDDPSHYDIVHTDNQLTDRGVLSLDGPGRAWFEWGDGRYPYRSYTLLKDKDNASDADLKNFLSRYLISIPRGSVIFWRTRPQISKYSVHWRSVVVSSKDVTPRIIDIPGFDEIPPIVPQSEGRS